MDRRRIARKPNHYTKPMTLQTTTKRMARPTTITADSSGRLRPTLPRALAREIDIYDFADPDDRRVSMTVDCTAGDGLSLSIRIGPSVGRGPHTQSTEVASSGQVQIRIPTFVGAAWNLVDTEIHWPSKDEIEIGDDGAARIPATIPDWEPVVPVGLGDLAGEQPASSLVKSTAETTGTDAYQATIPYDVTIEAGLVDGDRRVAAAMDCLDGQRVVVIRPTDTDGPNSLTVGLGGPRDRQARVSGAGLAAALGVVDQLDDSPVSLSWGGSEQQVVGYVDREESR